MYKRDNIWWFSYVDDNGKQQFRSTETSDRKLAEKIVAKFKNKSGNSLFFKGGMKAQYLISVLRYIKCIHCDNSTIMIPYANENHTS